VKHAWVLMLDVVIVLKRVKKKVKSWASEVFSCEKLKKQQQLDEIDALD